MNETTNYKLKKPESNEFVSIDDLNYNADKIDGELKNLNDKKVSASGGDIKDTVVSEFTASADQYPIPAAGDTPKTFLGKVKKFMEDIRSTVIGACYIGQIINNCVTNRSDLPLSAAQGKVLMDLYTVLNTKLSEMKEVLARKPDSFVYGEYSSIAFQLYYSSGKYYLQAILYSSEADNKTINLYSWDDDKEL